MDINISEEKKMDTINCPKCNKGRIIKGKTAYGCSDYKTGCDFKMTYDTIREKAKDRKLTKDLVYSILKGTN